MFPKNAPLLTRIGLVIQLFLPILILVGWFFTTLHELVDIGRDWRGLYIIGLIYIIVYLIVVCFFLFCFYLMFRFSGNTITTFFLLVYSFVIIYVAYVGVDIPRTLGYVIGIVPIPFYLLGLCFQKFSYVDYSNMESENESEETTGNNNGIFSKENRSLPRKWE